MKNTKPIIGRVSFGPAAAHHFPGPAPVSAVDQLRYNELLAIMRRCREAIDETFWAHIDLILNSPDVRSNEYQAASEGLRSAEHAFFDILIEIDKVLNEE
jgi:hypothetical protein